jgi:hypothetical protein
MDTLFSLFWGKIEGTRRRLRRRNRTSQWGRHRPTSWFQEKLGDDHLFSEHDSGSFLTFAGCMDRHRQ